MANPLNDFGLKIFLDRYAQKDTTKATLAVDDLVVVCVNQKTRQREVGNVVALLDNPGNKPKVVIRLLDGSEVTQDWDDVDKPTETTPEQTMARTARGTAAVEVEDKRGEWEEKFKWLLDEWRFVPGGRILASAGTDQRLSLFNCYVIGSPKDSRSGILHTLGEMTEIMSRGGGVGVNLSSLRPRYAYVKGVNGRSSGSVSWGGLFSFTTGLIEQGGSRRGALMLIVNDWHPDVLDFIDSKREAGKITNANISVGISDKFMDAVFADADWNLVFPDTTSPLYAERWTGDLDAWVKAGGPVVTYKTVKARAVWSKIIESAWASAEPGVFFLERYNKEANSAYFSPIVACNPCAEQGLPPNGCCNLGALNLAKFVDNKTVLWDDLAKAVTYAVRFLDNIVDVNEYFMDAIRDQQLGERRVGLGIMGLAEMMLRLEIRYGSDAGNKFVADLSKFIATTAYGASSDNAAEKGSFPQFDSKKIMTSGFMKRLPAELRAKIKQQGLRNVTLLTVAPTGTTGTMVDTSTGIEPYYSWTYWRKSRLGMSEIEVDIVRDWRAANPGVTELPDHFVTAMDLTPEQHVGVQAAMQTWIDSSISKTCNVPNEYTVEQTRELYELMYRLGCKGGTIYRDGSRDEQVLMLKAEPVAAVAAQAPDIDAEARKLGYVKIEDAATNPDVIAKILASVGVQAQPDLVSRRRKDKVMQSINCKQQTHLGSCYTDVTYDRNNDPLEIFVRSGKAGSDVASLAEGLGRLASTLLTMPSPVPPMERLRDIAGHLEGIGGSDSVGFGRAQIKSMPDAVGKSLSIIADELDTRKGKVTAAEPEEKVDESKPVRKSKKAAADICPSCGGATYIREEGCKHCTSCGHSACG